MPPPMQHRMPFHPNFINAQQQQQHQQQQQQQTMGMQPPPPHDPAAYQNHGYSGAYHHPPPPRQPMMPRHMQPGHHYPPGHMPQWGPGMQQNNSPDMRMRYPQQGYDGRPHPSYHPHSSMGPMANNMMHEMDDMKPKVVQSARSSSQKLSALYDPPDEAGRKEFIDKVLQYWEEKTLPLKHAPLMGRRTLDLFALYQHVKKRGFMQEVTRKKEWAEISNQMGLGNTSATGFTLKKQYCKYLYGFECRIERGETEPQEALARVIESNRKKKQQSDQHHAKMAEHSVVDNKAMMRPPHPHHPDMQRPGQPQNQYLPMNHPQMDPYSQHRVRPGMPGGHMDANNMQNMQMAGPPGMSYGQHQGYGHQQMPPTSYGHPQQIHQQQFRGHHPSYQHRSNNGYMPQPDPGQIMSPHTNSVRPPGPRVASPRPNFGSPYYRGAPPPSDNIPPAAMPAPVPSPAVDPNLNKPNVAYTAPNTELNISKPTEWSKDAGSLHVSLDNNNVTGSSDDTQKIPDETASVSSNQGSEAKPDAASIPSTASTPKPLTENSETTESNLPNTAPSTPALTSSSSSTPVPSSVASDTVTQKDVTQLSDENKPPLIPKTEPASSPMQSPMGFTAQQKSAEKLAEPSPQQQQPLLPSQGTNQYGVIAKSHDLVKQELNHPMHTPSPVGPYPFASGSPMPQNSPRPFIDNRAKMERPMHPGVYPPQHPYHQQPAYRGMTPPMQHINSFGHKRPSHSMEVYAPPNKIPRPDMGQYPDGYHGPPVRPPSQGNEMHPQYPYNRGSMHRPMHPDAHGHFGPGPQSMPPHHPQNYHPHYPKHVRPPGPHGDPGSPYPNSHQSVPSRRGRGSTAMGTSDSATKFLQGLVKDYSPSPQHHSSDPSTMTRSSSSTPSRSHPPSNVSNLLNGQQPYRSHQQGSSTSTQAPLFPPGCVEAIQPSFANFKEKMCQDVGVIEAWKVVMALKSGLLAESTWALNALTILLHDQNTIRQIVLHQLPGLLHTVIEHYRCSLNELFTIKKNHAEPESHKSDKLSSENHLSRYGLDAVSKHKANCFVKSTMDGKYIPAPPNVQSPFNRRPIKMSIESDASASLREFVWDEEDKELANERLHIISSFSGNSVFEFANNNNVPAPNSIDAEDHAAEVTLEDMLSIHSNNRCLSPNMLDDFENDDPCFMKSLPVADIKKVKETTNFLKEIESFSSTNKTDSLFAPKDDKASHIQSCLDRVSWKCDVVLLEDEATGFPGNSGLLIPYSKGGRYFLSSGGEHIFPKKLKEKESELVSRILCLSNLIRGLSCALYNHVDLCTHEDFLKTLAGTLLQCHKHRVRHFNYKKAPVFMSSYKTLFARGQTTNQVEEMEVVNSSQEDSTEEEVSKSEESTAEVDNVTEISTKGGCKRISSATPQDLQINGISSDSMRSDDDDSSHENNIQMDVVDKKKLKAAKKKTSKDGEKIPNGDKKVSKNDVKKDKCVAEVNGQCVTKKQLRSQNNSVESEMTAQKIENNTVTSTSSGLQIKDQNDNKEQQCTTDKNSDIRIQNPAHDNSSKISLSSTVLHDSISDQEDDYGFYNHPWWWECVRQVREDSLITLANLSTSMNFSQFTNENAMYTIIDACLHWSVCSSADAQDPFPSNSLRTILSPQSLSIEILTKLSMKEANVDLILATRPYRRLEKLFKKLTIMVGNRKDQMLREFAIVLLSNFSAVESASRAIALQSGAISNLLSFLEECEETGLNNQRMFPAGQDLNCGTISYMMQRCALTLLRLARINENRPLFLKHNLRLLSLSMAVLLGRPVLSILSSVLYELNNELPNR